MSSTEEEPSSKKVKVDPVSEDTPSPVLEHADSTDSVPDEQFSILSAMMDTVPDILVDNVLADLDFRDVFTFKCVSHRCEDIVLSNLHRLKKPEKVPIRITWANYKKSVIIGQRDGNSLFADYLIYGNRDGTSSEDKTFIVVTPTAGPMNPDPTISWREGAVLFEKKHSPGFDYSRTEVSSVGADDMDMLLFFLKRLTYLMQFLPHMVVNEMSAVRLEKEDFAIVSEILKTAREGMSNLAAREGMSNLALSEGGEVPVKKFPLITAMKNTISDILVDKVLSDLESGDVLNFERASHGCQDIVLSNLHRLKN